MAKHDISILEKEEYIPETSTYICENTDCVLDPLEQMIYALNETQLRFGHST